MYSITKGGQKEEIEKEDMENLNHILDEKDKLIEEINKIDIEF